MQFNYSEFSEVSIRGTLANLLLVRVGASNPILNNLPQVLVT